MAKRDADLHKNHRKRMKEQYLEYGIDAFNDHQLLEMFLFFAVPRADTNETAHRLINACGGTLKDVFMSDPETLKSVPGIKDHAAFLIKFIPDMMKRVMNENATEDCRGKMGIYEARCDFFEEIFSGVGKEELHAAAINARGKMVRQKKISEGSFSSVSVHTEKLHDFARKNSCKQLIIAHNHPGESFLPSRQDISCTEQLVSSFSVFGIDIIDHIIIGNEGGYSLRASRHCEEIWKY